MHSLVAIPALIAIAAAGLWTGSLAAMYADSIVPSAHASQPPSTVLAAEVPNFVVTIRTIGGPVRHVSADIEAILSGPMASAADKDRLAEAVMFSAAKILSDPATASAAGQSVASDMAEAASARLGGAVGIHLRKLSVFDQVPG